MWKIFVLLGLVLQAASGVPPVIFVARPDPIKIESEVGVITRIEQKLSPRERVLLGIGLGLLILGSICQIVGVSLSH